MNIKERIEMVRAMELIARCINDEEVFDTWILRGIPDGTITENTDDGELADYIEVLRDSDFADIMTTFLLCMRNAYSSGGLYCDDVLSDSVD